MIAPAPIAAGGRAGSKALFLLGNMLRQAQDVKAAAPWLLGVAVIICLTRSENVLLAGSEDQARH